MAARATKTVNPLHFEDLEPHRFEDLVRQLIYNFRDWTMLEALGRSGADDGIDIRGLEASGQLFEPDELDEEREEDDTSVTARDESRQVRTWIIQCKRYSRLTPKQVADIVKSNLSGQADKPYGYILVAACDFSLKAREGFHAAVTKQKVQEAYLIGKAELEDMLFRPSNDHLLFAYFGISLQIRRRSNRTRLRSNIALKKAIIKHLGELRGRPDKHVLIRDPQDSNYPHHDEPGILWIEPSWRYWQFAGHQPLDHVTFVKKRCYAYFNPETEEWDALLDFDTERPHPQLHDRAEMPPEMKALADESHELWFYEVPSRRQAWYYELAVIPFDRILAIDEVGDAFHDGPHLLVDFRAPGEPFEGETYEIIEPVEGHNWHFFRVRDLKRTDYLRQLREQRRKERASADPEERLSVIVAKMGEVWEKFLHATAEHLFAWYWKTTTSIVVNKPEYTQEIGKEKLSSLKSEVQSLQQGAYEIVNETVGAEDFWWDLKPNNQNYSFYGNRAPEGMDEAIRYAAGRLAPILQKYGYLAGHDGWRKPPKQRHYSTDPRPYYPNWMEWSEDMRLLLEEYDILQSRGQRLTPVSHDPVLPEEPSAVKQLWLDA